MKPIKISVACGAQLVSVVANKVTYADMKVTHYPVSVWLDQWPVEFRCDGGGEGKRFIAKDGFEVRSCLAPSLHSGAIYGPGARRFDQQRQEPVCINFSNPQAMESYIRRLKRAIREFNQHARAGMV